MSWFAKGLWKRRRPIQILIAITAVFALVVMGWYQLGKRRPPATMTDPTFERAANAICAKRLPQLRAVRREKQTESNLETQTADRIDQVATKLGGIVEDLRALNPKPQNQAQVDAWFGHYDDYIAAGQRYAAAIRTGKDSLYNKVDDQGVAPLKAISHFARANHLDACIP